MKLAPAGAGETRLAAPMRAPAASPSTGDPKGANDFSLVVDLGTGIGSRDWLRGLGTCMALCYAAISFWPNIGSVEGLSPPPFTDLQAEEADAFTIAPIATGSATGRRMAPSDAVQPILDAPERATVELRASLSTAGDLGGALARAGVSQSEATQVAAMVARLVPLADIPAGTILDIRLGRRDRATDPRPLDKLSFRANFAVKIEVERVGGALTVNRVAVAVDATPLRIQGTIGPSLYRSARAAGVPARIVESFIRILSSQIGIPSGIGPSDRFDMVIEHRRTPGGESETGELLYAGIERADGRAVRMMPWNVGGTSRWFEASGVGRETSGGFRSPVPNGHLTSPFGNRFHPILHYVRMHTGLDIGAPYGSQIVAASGGQVILAGWSGGYGRSVRIDHGSGITTVYGHMSGLTVSSGQRVSAGQLIGYVGSTGLSTGPHLHFEVRRGGVPVNPAGFAFTARSDLAGADLEAFRARMRALLALPAGAMPASAIAAAGPVAPPAPPASAQPGPPRPGEW
jgi:murein DD-endopeptidase MepM/ murein hydrolase activator NlpD